MNEISGKGRYVWPDGKTFEGQWEKNKMHGYGVLTWKDGKKYEDISSMINAKDRVNSPGRMVESMTECGVMENNTAAESSFPRTQWNASANGKTERKSDGSVE